MIINDHKQLSNFPDLPPYRTMAQRVQRKLGQMVDVVSVGGPGLVCGRHRKVRRVQVAGQRRMMTHRHRHRNGYVVRPDQRGKHGALQQLLEEILSAG